MVRPSAVGSIVLQQMGVHANGAIAISIAIIYKARGEGKGKVQDYGPWKKTQDGYSICYSL